MAGSGTHVGGFSVEVEDHEIETDAHDEDEHRGERPARTAAVILLQRLKHRPAQGISSTAAEEDGSWGAAKAPSTLDVQHEKMEAGPILIHTASRVTWCMQCG